MGRRPTIADLARKAGVSVATVDRVLNGRHPVREETARRVYQAASEIGYHAAALIHQRITADLPKMDLAFLLQKEGQPFYQAFAKAIREAADATAGVRVRAEIEFVKTQSPAEVAERLQSLARRAQAVAATSLDHHMVTQVVQDLKVEGKPVFSLLSDFAQGVRESYLGLNNLKVGRTAAWLISRTAPRPGKVAIFVGSHRWHGHELRETGFRSYFREYAPRFEILETLVNLETRQVTHEATLNLLDRHPDIAGFYVAGGGMEGAITALREERPVPLPSVVVNELTPDSSAALQDHIITATIVTPLPSLCRALIDLMVGTVRAGPSETPGQLFLPLSLHVPESL
ncbi:LacI family DNA-binding transcriptional regulator [Chelativorans sp. AA-79]|uniref:LacI family DNA-binding transcriptional regulator n=1 Tax=Chelativorans sp. AA-79 TaxID=3028735 RepID=UPI0023F84560|nr:LacI family DNA-binding transcriptional regulator [Chelativorans sp. AA-79]WEX08395.1 LacI family DNA-binding transcriptional regulator [Chelativorans sp. AA-79]